mmetsp:Transcript_110013/g.164606  ORF Transcript_110013/g.164606 Transcript_110013/m.164606 type:complete len:244 (+) Transcript_110013:639-1370(+)
MNWNSWDGVKFQSTQMFLDPWRVKPCRTFGSSLSNNRSVSATMTKPGMASSVHFTSSVVAFLSSLRMLGSSGTTRSLMYTWLLSVIEPSSTKEWFNRLFSRNSTKTLRTRTTLPNSSSTIVVSRPTQTPAGRLRNPCVSLGTMVKSTLCSETLIGLRHVKLRRAFLSDLNSVFVIWLTTKQQTILLPCATHKIFLPSWSLSSICRVLTLQTSTRFSNSCANRVTAPLVLSWPWCPPPTLTIRI